MDQAGIVTFNRPHEMLETGLVAVSIRTDPHTIKSKVRREDGSLVGGGTYEVPPDAKSLTATNFGYGSQLHQFHQDGVGPEVK